MNFGKEKMIKFAKRGKIEEAGDIFDLIEDNPALFDLLFVDAIESLLNERDLKSVEFLIDAGESKIENCSSYLDFHIVLALWACGKTSEAVTHLNNSLRKNPRVAMLRGIKMLIQSNDVDPFILVSK